MDRIIEAEPLKDKGYYGGDMDWREWYEDDQIFFRNDVVSAVQWLKEQLKNHIGHITFKETNDLVDEAFEDVKQ